MLSTRKKFVMNIISIAIFIYGIAILPSLFMAVRYNELGIFESMSAIAIVCIPLGIFGHKALPNDLDNVPMSVCYVTTLMTWAIVIILSALPYYFAGEGYKIVDCFFESIASWTTTGASAIPTESLPVPLKIWRSECNWMGGIGIILLTLTFVSKWQFVGQKLASTEIRGPEFLMSNTTFRQAYRRILGIYCGMTVVHYLALRIAGMTQMNSLLTALSNISTSGLQHLNNGVISGFPLAIKIVIVAFAFFGSINVGIFVLALIGKFKRLIQQSELKMYLLIIAVATILLSGSSMLAHKGTPFFSTIGNTLMQVISFASTAGFIVTEYDSLNAFMLCVIMILMFIGACAISTGGGLKISRIVYAAKSLSNNIYTHVHPNSVRTETYNGQPASKDNFTQSNMYIATFMLLYLFGGILITADGTDAFTALSYSQAMLTNVGSPISELADPGIVSHMTDYSKCIMCFLMLCGRLEIYPVMMVFSYRLWFGDKSKAKFKKALKDISRDDY